jgi:hypothetical protein
MSNPLDEIAPYPRTVEEATAESVALHLVAEGYMLNSRRSGLMRKMVEAEGTPEHAAAMERYAINLSAVTADYAAAKALRTIAAEDAELADTLAKAIWRFWEDGAAVGEELWHWLRQAGIDPDQVEAAA